MTDQSHLGSLHQPVPPPPEDWWQPGGIRRTPQPAEGCHALGVQVAGSGDRDQPGVGSSLPHWVMTTWLTQGPAKAAWPKPPRWSQKPSPAGPGVRQGDLQGQLC